jgi:hypothetical protein
MMQMMLQQQRQQGQASQSGLGSSRGALCVTRLVQHLCQLVGMLPARHQQQLAVVQRRRQIQLLPHACCAGRAQRGGLGQTFWQLQGRSAKH